jgi:hypothetical protein
MTKKGAMMSRHANAALRRFCCAGVPHERVVATAIGIPLAIGIADGNADGKREKQQERGGA